MYTVARPARRRNPEWPSQSSDSISIESRIFADSNPRTGVRMSYETLIWEQSGAAGRLTLNRPDSLNAWTPEFGHELKQVVKGEAADPSVRAVMITGAGRGFSSGADLKAGFEPHPDDGRPDVRKELDDVYHPIITGLRELEKPVVAAVNGP